MIKKSIVLLCVAILPFGLSAMYRQIIEYRKEALGVGNIVDTLKTNYKLGVNKYRLTVVETVNESFRKKKTYLHELLKNGEQVHLCCFKYKNPPEEILQPNSNTIKLLNLLRDEFFNLHSKDKIQYLNTKALNGICEKFNKNVIPKILQSKRTRRLLHGK